MKERSSRWLATAIYALIVTILAFNHEMWRDEVRAFSVATRARSWGSLISELHHEGHPILWYALLRVGNAITGSHLVLPIIALVIGIITAWLILKYAPFPLWLRLLAVFGAFLGDELTVVARNYGIGVLLMICAAMAFAHRKTRPLVLAVCLALLANTSVHAALAAMVLLALWLTDFFDPAARQELLSLQAVVGIVVVAAGIAVGLWTAHPSPDMAWSLSPTLLNPQKVLATIFTDPGVALRGVYWADIAAAGELPWRLVRITPDITRYIVDAILLWLLWNFRRDWRSLAAIVLTVLGFEVVFRNVYSGALRQEGVIVFLLFSIAWFAVVRAGEKGTGATASRRIALALLPLFAFQTLAFPVLIQRYFKYRQSNSKAYAAFVRNHPRYANAILMSEPDFMMEPMPYYLSNRIFMPRQREFAYRVYFDTGKKRQSKLSLGQLAAVADSVSCVYKVPVLLAISDRNFESHPVGFDTPQYKGTVFSWNESEWRRFHASSPLVAEFPYATTDEIYRIHEVKCPTN